MTSFIPQKYNAILIKIYDLTILQKEKVTFSKLTEFFDKKELCSTLVYLCNHCIVEEVWDNSSGQWIRTFEIGRQYIPFVKKLKELAV